MAQRMSGQRIYGILPRVGRGLRSGLLFVALAWGHATLPCLGQVGGADLEARVKAAYIYNFTKFVYWQKGADTALASPVAIFIVGDDPIVDLLENFSEKQASGQTITVKKIGAESLDPTSCQLLFIGQSAERQLPALLKQLQGTSVLTVSGISEFARQGGMIGFIVKDGRVKIEINLDAVNKAGLKISAKLLEIARIISSED
jgi:hypothetical protein